MNIFALSSGRGPCGIAIIRMSGPDTLQICKLISKENNIKENEINLCRFFDPSNGTIIDPEALILWFPKPNSFTGDDLAEFHVHGSNAIISYFLKVLSSQKNCRMAEPGEFTKIAFQNNKIDLLKAESIGDLIHSETELQRKQAVNLVNGQASKYYDDIRSKLIKSLSFIEAKIDFAEEDLPENVLKEAHKTIKSIHSDISKILDDNKVGEKIRDGFRVSIIGETNVGKSSLLNLLSKREAAIVSDEAGTTRDVIEIYLNLDGYPVILADTAGIREAKNDVEKKGISLALSKYEDADINIVVIDNSNKKISEKIKSMINKDSIVLLNKSDVQAKESHKFNTDTVLASVKNNKNIDELINLVKKN